MKKIIVFANLLIIATATFSQQTKSSLALTKQDYLKKSKNQKTAAWLFLAGGTTIILTGGAVYPKDYAYDYDFPINSRSQIRQAHLSSALFWTGMSSMLVSIPLFLASKRNKWEARKANACLKMETTPIFQRQSIVNISYPALSVKINLRSTIF